MASVCQRWEVKINSNQIPKTWIDRKKNSHPDVGVFEAQRKWNLVLGKGNTPMPWLLLHPSGFPFLLHLGMCAPFSDCCQRDGYFPVFIISRADRFALASCTSTEKALAPHSSTLAWKLPWTEDPGRLQSMGSLRVGHDWATSLSLFTFMHWRRKWQPTPVFLPGETQGWGSLVGCCLWGHIESDTTEVT